MTATPRHECRPLHIAGRLVATCDQHWMTLPAGTAASLPAGAR